MRPVVRLFTIAVLSTCAWWCMRPVPAVHAQIMECNAYDRQDEDPCDTCCSVGTYQQNVTDGFVNGPGMQTIVENSEDCGTSVSCPGPNPNGYCGTTFFNQAVDDPADCCLPEGSPCNQGICCDDLVCLSNNSCGQCLQDGSSCYYDTDCCSEFCNSDSNTCGPACGLSGDYCSVDSDCCSYACFGGYCQ